MYGLPLSLINWSAWVLLLLGFVITAFLTLSFKSIEEVKTQDQVSSIGKRIQANIEAYLYVHEEVLKGAVALFEASENVDRREWHNYSKHIKRDNHFKGIQGLGFALSIPSGRLPDHIAEIRREGFPDYNVWPDGHRDLYTSIVYLEPLTTYQFKSRNRIA